MSEENNEVVVDKKAEKARKRAEKEEKRRSLPYYSFNDYHKLKLWL